MLGPDLVLACLSGPLCAGAAVTGTLWDRQLQVVSVGRSAAVTLAGRLTCLVLEPAGPGSSRWCCGAALAAWLQGRGQLGGETPERLLAVAEL